MFKGGNAFLAMIVLAAALDAATGSGDDSAVGASSSGGASTAGSSGLPRSASANASSSPPRWGSASRVGGAPGDGTGVTPVALDRRLDPAMARRDDVQGDGADERMELLLPDRADHPLTDLDR